MNSKTGNSPLVSIVLPMYNAAKYIKECVDSILAQTYSDFELLIIDDGSTDDSVKIVETYKDSRIRLIRNSHDFIASLNKGIVESRGKYIARMDADDKMKPHRLEKQVEVMETMPEIVLCCSYMQRMGGTDIYNAGIKGRFPHFKSLLLVGNFISHPTTMMRKDYLKTNELNYRNGYPYAEDYKLWTEIALLGGGLYIVPEPLIDYRVSDSQVSRMHHNTQEASALKIRNELLSYLIEHEGCEYKTDISNLYDNFAALNEKNLIDEGTIFTVFYRLFSILEVKNK